MASAGPDDCRQNTCNGAGLINTQLNKNYFIGKIILCKVRDVEFHILFSSNKFLFEVEIIIRITRLTVKSIIKRLKNNNKLVLCLHSV